MVATDTLRNRLDDFHGDRLQRQNQWPAVFRPIRWDRPHSALAIEFAPAHAADLGAPRAGKDQKLDDLAIGAVTDRAPYGCELVIFQHALPRLGILERPNDRIVLH